MVPPGAEPPVYVERLTPPPAIWAAVLVFGLLLGLSFYAVLGPVAGVLATVLPAALGVAVLASTTAKVRVDGGVLRAGAAHIHVADLGPARALDDAESRSVRGPASDPAAFHLIRGWLPRGVVASVVDSTDPTPYWFIASRQPERLAAAIEAARTV